MSNICVIGAGYVGLVTATGFAELGHKLSLVEIDTGKLCSLKRGEVPIHEPGLKKPFQRHLTEGNIRVTDNYIDGLLNAEFAFIAVGTPSTNNGKPDLKWVRQAARSIAESASGPLTVVIKSTVPVGTACLVSKILTRYCQNGHKFPVVSNPEFLREGLAVFDFMNPARIVVGGSNPAASEAVVKLYQTLGAETIVCDSETAEMSKYACNVFLATRISFMNELALLCDEYGVDIVKVASIMGLDPRFGKGYLSAGLGWGGSCLPKDIRGVIHMAKSRGIPLRLIRAVQQINHQQARIVVNKLRRILGPLEGTTIGILGLAFKPDSDDMREASSLNLISLLREQGCNIKAYDPVAMEAASRLAHDITYCADAYEVARGSHALVLATEWAEFKELDLPLLASLMRRPVMIDGRNIYSPETMSHAGFIYEGIGRRTAETSINSCGVIP
jgi:UDPglucose 6-dehydrogenase